MRIDRFKNFDWLAVVFYPLAVILMEAFWVSPWLSWVGFWSFFSEARPVLSLASVIIVIVASLVITRIFTQQQWSLWKIQLIIIGSGLLTMLLVLAVEYNDGYTFLSSGWFGHIGQALGNTFTHASTISMAIPAIVYLWWRGIMLGQSTSYFRDIYRSFLLGMAALVVLIIFWQISATSGSIPKPGGEIGIDVICFFFFGLLAIAITHLYNMRRAMPKEDARLTSVWRWLPVMFGVIGGMIIIGFGVASAMSPDIIDTIGHGANVFFGFLGKIFEYIMIPFLYIAQGLIIALYWFVGLLGGGQQGQTEISNNMTMPQFGETQGTELSPLVTSIIKWSVLAIIIAIVIFFLAKAITRYRARHAQEDFDEVRESLFSWRGLRDDLKELFRSIGRRRKPLKAPTYNFDEDTRRLDIREIYRHMQWEAGRSGIPRRRHETAEEYAQRIEHLVPDSSLPLNSLTDMYEDVRYGEEIASVDKEDSANSIWQTLKGMIRRLRGA
jgi:large-conductance mechanosensitive channel